MSHFGDGISSECNDSAKSAALTCLTACLFSTLCTKVRSRTRSATCSAKKPGDTEPSYARSSMNVATGCAASESHHHGTRQTRLKEKLSPKQRSSTDSGSEMVQRLSERRFQAVSDRGVPVSGDPEGSKRQTLRQSTRLRQPSRYVCELSFGTLGNIANLETLGLKRPATTVMLRNRVDPTPFRSSLSKALPN